MAAGEESTQVIYRRMKFFGVLFPCGVSRSEFRTTTAGPPPPSI